MPSFPAAGSPAGQPNVRHGPHPAVARASRSFGRAGPGADKPPGHARQAAGLGRQRLRVALPPDLPDALAAETASLLMPAAAAAHVDVTWVETPLDGEFSLIHQRKADAGLGWLSGAGEDLPAPLDVMSLGEFEPVLWIPSWHPAARRGTFTVEELTRMTVVYGPRRADVGTYDHWLGVLRAAGPRGTRD